MKIIRIVLLIFIIIGLGLLATQKFWVPKVVEMILQKEYPAQVAVPEVQADMTGWKTYMNTKYGFSINIPQNWIVKEKSGYIWFISPKTIQINKTNCTTSDFPCGDPVSPVDIVFSTIDDRANADPKEKVFNVKIGSTTWTRFLESGIDAGASYLTTKGGIVYSFTTANNDLYGISNNDNQLNQILSTFKFTK